MWSMYLFHKDKLFFGERRTLELGTIGPKDFTDLSLLFWRLN